MKQVLLHSCCAPCSAAIIEWMMNNGYKPTIFFSNSNIFPLEEYKHRQSELERFMQEKGLRYVEDGYNHTEWLAGIHGLENEPERGERCTQCFRFRLLRAARYAKANGFALLATTLASSRWKDIEQVNAAGQWAAEQVGHVEFWAKNWRKGGLQDRRNELLRQYAFYNQQYCGCEFSKFKSIGQNQS